MGFSRKNSLFYVIVALAGLLLSQVNCALTPKTVKEFQTGPFTFSPQAGIYNLTELGFGGITAGLTPLAFGDFNSDKYTDLVAVTDNNKTLHVFLWNHDNHTFNNSQTITFDNDLLSIISIDVNYDGLVDLLAITKSGTAGTYNYYVYLGVKTNTPFPEKYTSTFSYPSQQPTVAYLDDTFKPSLILMNTNNERVAVSFLTDGNTITTKETDFSQFVSTATGCLAYDKVSGATIQNPHYNSFVDLNGDCRSDLFIMSTQNNKNYFEIWIRSAETAKFCLVENTLVKATVASLAFTDINGDSGLDLVYIQQDTVPIMHIIFNQFKNTAGTACTGTNASETILPFLNSTVEARNNIYDATTNTTATLVYPLNSLLNTTGAKMYSFDPTSRPHQLRFGDINMDGNPDALVTLVLTNGTRKTLVLYNNPAGESKSLRELSLLKPSELGVDVNEEIADLGSYYASFFDFDEIGTQSLIYVKGVDGYSTIEGYYNNLNQASFFLKALGLDGAQANSSDFYAGMYYGSSFECEVTDINGTNILRKGFQLSRGAFTALQLPYAFLGLGKTNNYIENFVYGYSISGTNTHKWSPIIPNSQLIITPTGTDASNWKIDVFVKPTSNTLIVVITTAAILIVLGMVICYLHLKEKEEDKQHQEKYLHLLG